ELALRAADARDDQLAQIVREQSAAGRRRRRRARRAHECRAAVAIPRGSRRWPGDNRAPQADRRSGSAQRVAKVHARPRRAREDARRRTRARKAAAEEATVVASAEVRATSRPNAWAGSHHT